jgi:hypothetical protein
LLKIGQLNYHLPETSPADRGAYLAGLFSPRAREALPEEGGVDGSREGDEPARGLPWRRETVTRPMQGRPLELEDTRVELDAFTELQDAIEDNPRELKRLVNVHRFVKVVLQPPGVAVEAAGQRQLVRWLVLCARWPELVDDVIDHAEKNTQEDDCLRAYHTLLDIDALGLVTDELRALAFVAEKGEPLPAQALLDRDWLRRAAEISLLMRREPAPQRSDPDAEARPEPEAEGSDAAAEAPAASPPSRAPSTRPSPRPSSGSNPP